METPWFCKQVKRCKENKTLYLQYITDKTPRVYGNNKIIHNKTHSLDRKKTKKTGSDYQKI